MLILCLCCEEHHWKLLPGIADAFRRQGIEFLCAQEPATPNSHLSEFLRLCQHRPSWIFHFECNRSILPEGLVESEIPTVYFDVDTYAFTRRRMRWASLFDHVAVFHPGYEQLFRRSGHRGAFLHPHAVCREFFEGPELAREYEVGWVGQTSGGLYRTRAQWLPRLQSNFRMNDWSGFHTLREVADVYRRARVVVNFGRDDFPQDANMRVFEVLASGALLVTSLPNELSDLGFREGVHFVGYRQEDEILSLVRHYLSDETSRIRIADAGKEKALSEHTYDRRVAQVLAHLDNVGQKKLAPARSWPRPRARLMALDFFSSTGELRCSATQFWHIVGRGFRETIEGAFLLLKAWVRHRGLFRGSAK